MKKVVLGIAAAAALITAAGAAALPPGYLNKEESMPGYLENTLVRIIYGTYENHYWYDGTVQGGTAVEFDATKDQAGNVNLKALEYKWKFDDGYRPRVIPIAADGKESTAVELQNAFPGNMWRMLWADGPYANQRETYMLFPGHQ